MYSINLHVYLIIDACEQPKEEGPCRGQYRRYYYDKESKQCREFIYGGCKGNNNNFQTMEACNQNCAKPNRKKGMFLLIYKYITHSNMHFY